MAHFHLISFILWPAIFEYTTRKEKPGSYLSSRYPFNVPFTAYYSESVSGSNDGTGIIQASVDLHRRPSLNLESQQFGMLACSATTAIQLVVGGD